MDMTSVYAPITKSYEQDDGSVIVEGIITDGNLDLDQQRCDPIWLKTAVPQWMEFGNLREQHQKDRAIGRAFEHRDLGDAGHFIRGRVVDSEAVKKVKGGVFNGFSIGVKDYHLSKSADAPNGLIDGGRICEVSLVDFPCNENCRLTMVKSAKPGMKMRASDFDSERMLVRVEEFMEKSVSPELKKAAESMTVTLADALSPEQAATLAGKVTEEIAARADEELIPVGHGVIDKTTSVDHLDAPAPGQVCVTCGTAGHLACGDSLSAAFEQIGKELADGFDRDAAIELVTKTVANADAGLGQDEMPDINGALQAIQIIAGLIQREAQALGTTPAQGCDIDLLMQAVHALRCFNRREAQEQAGINPMEFSADAEVTKDSKESTMDKQTADVEVDAAKTAAPEAAETVLEVTDGAEKAVEAANETSEVLEAVAGETIEVSKSAPQEDEADKSADPETTKATTVEPDVDAITKAISAALEKAFSTEELDKEDNPLRKTLGAVVSAATESVAKSVSDLTERLELVEQMATPGGPAQRRPDAAAKNTERTELLAKARYWRDRSENAHDPDLRKGYAAYAVEYQMQADKLAA